MRWRCGELGALKLGYGAGRLCGYRFMEKGSMCES